MNSNQIVAEVGRSQSLIRWIERSIDGIDLPASDRVRMAATCFDLAMEHQQAIVLLIAQQLFGKEAKFCCSCEQR